MDDKPEGEKRWFVRTTKSNYRVAITASLILFLFNLSSWLFFWAPSGNIPNANVFYVRTLLLCVVTFYASYNVVQYVLTRRHVEPVFRPDYEEKGSSAFIYFLCYLAVLIVLLYTPFKHL